MAQAVWRAPTSSPMNGSATRASPATPCDASFRLSITLPIALYQSSVALMSRSALGLAA